MELSELRLTYNKCSINITILILILELNYEYMPGEKIDI